MLQSMFFYKVENTNQVTTYLCRCLLLESVTCITSCIHPVNIYWAPAVCQTIFILWVIWNFIDINYGSDKDKDWQFQEKEKKKKEEIAKKCFSVSLII